MMRVGVFVEGRGESTPYGRLLTAWAKDQENVCLFTNAPKDSGDIHYLRFASIHTYRPFDVLIYDIADTRNHAEFFPIITKYPGVLFCYDLSLWNFTRAISHDPRDPWGTGWIFNTAAPEKAEELSSLAEAGMVLSEIIEKNPLGAALIARSGGAIVPTQEKRDQIPLNVKLPEIEVVPKSISQLEFASFMVLQLPVWNRAIINARNEIKPIEHPFHDLYAVELGRIMERYGGGTQEQLNRALQGLREMFEGATNSAFTERENQE